MKDNQEQQKTAMTLSVSYSPSDSFPFDGQYCFVSTFKGYGTPGATPYEQPGRPGFSGSALLDKNNDVIAVATNISHYVGFGDLEKHYPKTSWLLDRTHKLMGKFDPWHYQATVFGIGSALTYSLGNTYLGWGAFALTACASKLSYYIPAVDTEIRRHLYPKGIQSYFCSTAPWSNRISEICQRQQRSQG